MSSLDEIRAAIAATLSANLSNVMVYEYSPDVFQLPAIIVRPSVTTANFEGAMQMGDDQWYFDIIAVVSRTQAQVAQKNLDAFLTGSGPQSIRQIIYDNENLGLDDSTAFVVGVRSYGGSFIAASVAHIGAIVRLVVHTSG